jgi:hypothetical protein
VRRRITVVLSREGHRISYTSTSTIDALDYAEHMALWGFHHDATKKETIYAPDSHSYSRWTAARLR